MPLQAQGSCSRTRMRKSCGSRSDGTSRPRGARPRVRLRRTCVLHVRQPLPGMSTGPGMDQGQGQVWTGARAGLREGGGGLGAGRSCRLQQCSTASTQARTTGPRAHRSPLLPLALACSARSCCSACTGVRSRPRASLTASTMLGCGPTASTVYMWSFSGRHPCSSSSSRS